MKMVIMPLDSTKSLNGLYTINQSKMNWRDGQRSVVYYFRTKAVGRSLETNTIAHFWQSSPLGRSNGGKPFTPQRKHERIYGKCLFSIC